MDIFSIIKHYLNALKKQNWGDEYQLVTVYTTLLKSISNGAIFYSDEITTKIIKELEPKVEEKEKKNYPTKKKRRIGLMELKMLFPIFKILKDQNQKLSIILNLKLVLH